MICLDTNILIFGIQRRAAPEYQAQMEAASYYLDSLAEDDDVMIPSIVVAEYLQGFPDPNVRQQQYEILARRFIIPSFDAHAAKIAADIGVKLGRLRDIDELSGLSKPEVRADVNIIATAVANGANVMMTFNLTEYQRIVERAGLERRLTVKNVTVATQPRLLSTDAHGSDQKN